MIKQIFGFGCSWIHGDEIQHPNANIDSKEQQQYREQNCTLGQLATCLGIEYDSATMHNRGISGGSLQSTIWEFTRVSDRFTTDSLIVIGLTESSRQSWYNLDNRSPYMHSHWSHPEHTWEEFVKFYTVHSDCEQLWKMNYMVAVNYFSNYCAVNQIPLLMFNVFPPPVQLAQVPDWNARGFVQDMHNTYGDCLAPHKHANEKGSKLLAEKLALLINIDA